MMGLKAFIVLLLANGVAALTAFVSHITGVRSVPEGWRLLPTRFKAARRTRNGQYMVRNPGLHLLAPLIDGAVLICVQEQVLVVPEFEVTTGDGAAFRIKLAAVIQVRDNKPNLGKAAYTTDDYLQSLREIASTAAQDVLSGSTHHDLHGPRKARTDKQLKREFATQADLWGVRVIKFRIASREPIRDTEKLIQLPARKKALDEAFGENWNPVIAAALLGGPVVATGVEDPHQQLLHRNGTGSHESVPTPG